jgi:hypothetical protein
VERVWVRTRRRAEATNQQEVCRVPNRQRKASRRNSSSARRITTTRMSPKMSKAKLSD